MKAPVNRQVALYFSILFVGLVFIGAGCSSTSPDSTDPDLGIDEGGSMDCQSTCDSLENRLKDLREKKTKELLDGTGCSYGPAADGSNSEFDGEMLSGNEYNCPNQAAAEKLGDAIQKDKSSRDSRLDKDIDKTKQQIEDNCPCMVLVHQCVLCAGVPPGGICSTAFVTSQEECTEMGGEFQETILP